MKRVREGSRGSITIEFALLAPLFVFMLAACLEVSRIQIASMLLDRAVYDIAYQARVARGENFEAIVSQVLDRRNNSIFRPEEVTVTAYSSDDLETIVEGGAAGGGEANDFVHLQLTATLGLFSNLVPEPLQMEKIIDYYYINEPDLKAVH